MLSVPEEESPLHHLHLRLCEWPASLIAAEMRSDTRFAAWVAKHLPPDLLEFVNASQRPEKLLSQSKLRVLADVVDDAACFDNVLAKTWNPQPIPGYLDGRICLGEIASAVGIHAANDFAKRCARHIATLESRRMCLGEAIGVIADWIGEIEDIRQALAQHKTMPEPDRVALGQSGARQQKRKLTPREVARRFGISPDKVLAWIHSGELRAVDASSAASSRPRYFVDEAELANFEKRRSTNPRATRTPRRSAKVDTLEFF